MARRCYLCDAELHSDSKCYRRWVDTSVSDRSWVSVSSRGRVWAGGGDRVTRGIRTICGLCEYNRIIAEVAHATRIREGWRGVAAIAMVLGPLFLAMQIFPGH